MPRRIERYAKPVRVYFWPNVEQDALVLEVHRAIPSAERPQDIFRRAVFLGLQQMAAAGELPQRVLSSNRIGERLARRLPPAFTAPAAHAPAPAMIPAAAAYPAPVEDAFPAAPAVGGSGAAMTFEEAEEAEPSLDAILRLMGGDRPMTREDM